jgi:hypothetical protein
MSAAVSGLPSASATSRGVAPSRLVCFASMGSPCSCRNSITSFQPWNAAPCAAVRPATRGRWNPMLSSVVRPPSVAPAASSSVLVATAAAPGL